MTKLTIIDLFSGAGGLTEGFRSKNFEILGHVEMNKAACTTLELRDAFYWLKNKNEIQLYSDFLNGDLPLNELLSKVDQKLLHRTLNVTMSRQTLQSIFDFFDKSLCGGNVDGVIGGPPCQAYSTIGRARNAPKKSTDERIYLYKYYIEFLNRYNPKFFVFENVKGLKSFRDIDGKLLLPKMKKEFESAGYSLGVKTIDMSAYGVPQTRERVIIYGVPKKNRSQISRFFKYLQQTMEPAVNVKEVFADLPALTAGQEINRYSGEPNSFIKCNYRCMANIPLTQNISRPNSETDLKIYRQVVLAKRKGENLKYDNLPLQLQKHKHKDIFLDRFKVLDSCKPAHTIVAHIAKDGHHYIHPDIAQNRSITVREAARLQGFPDDYYFETSRTQAFLQIGNAVPPIFSRKIAASVSKLMLS
ncbi:restriction endonuclease subunit M [Lentilactobacillus fungorum]|uniref:Cytosine-specific methyltransferase n=1 Tax=Lentilactobacillus fungorum TaxID=2201250 RepID=A0ABQ3VZC7_9LACO|nr:DNA cytosine methyltransferase [Lentilactobacillus fungorum]GHP13920.1 restriction endonuclease subunit M [Lentilactobacillus fungorum]